MGLSLLWLNWTTIQTIHKCSINNRLQCRHPCISGRDELTDLSQTKIIWRQQGPYIQIHFLHEKVKQNIINSVEENALENVKCTIPYLRSTLGIGASFSWYFHSLCICSHWAANWCHAKQACKLWVNSRSFKSNQHFPCLTRLLQITWSQVLCSGYIFFIKTWNSSLFFCHFISSMSQRIAFQVNIAEINIIF